MIGYEHDVTRVEVEPDYKGADSWIRINIYGPDDRVLSSLTLFSEPGKRFDIRKQVIHAVREVLV